MQSNFSGSQIFVNTLQFSHNLLIILSKFIPVFVIILLGVFVEFQVGFVPIIIGVRMVMLFYVRDERTKWGDIIVFTRYKATAGTKQYRYKDHTH